MVGRFTLGMTKSDKPVHFEVRLSKVTGQNNITLDVITFTAARAIILALGKYPEGNIHVVQRRGSSNLVFDPEFIEQVIEDYHQENRR